jgi:hypothetical protein
MLGVALHKSEASAYQQAATHDGKEPSRVVGPSIGQALGL